MPCTGFSHAFFSYVVALLMSPGDAATNGNFVHIFSLHFPLQLLHDLPELLRHRQPDARGVFGDGDAFVGAVEENHGGSEHAAAADDLRVE